MDYSTLGKILATVVTSAIDAGAIVTSSGGILTDPDSLSKIISGFLQIWLPHPASGKASGLIPPKG